MQFPLEALASLATIAGTVISLLLLLQSSSWLILISLFFVGLSVAAALYARRVRLTVDAASTVIEGHSIDSLNIRSLRQSVNRTFFIQEAHHTARITGEDLEITCKFSGYCRKDRVSAFEFSIGSDASTSFAQMHCVGFDLGHDPDMTHEIRPVLVGAEGISKRISVPLLEPLRADQPFGVLLKCTLPRCVNVGFSYCTSTLPFAQDRVPRCTVRVIFVGSSPTWLRVYETALRQPAALVKTLRPAREEPDLCEYVDVAEDRPGQSARVYVFWRDSA